MKTWKKNNSKRKLLDEIENLKVELTEVRDTYIKTKNANETLIAEKEIFLSLIETVPYGIYRIQVFSEAKTSEEKWQSLNEAPYKVLFVNERFCEILNLDKETYIKNPGVILNYVYIDDMPDFVKKNTEANREEMPFIWEGRFLVNDKIIYANFKSLPSKQANGDIIWTGILYDISERKRAEEEIIQMNLELKKMNTEKDTFFSIIAHDLKGPIGNISNILNTFELNNIEDKLLFHLRSSAQNTYELLLELLTWAQVQRNQIEIEPTNFNVTQAFKKAVSSLQLSANKKGVQLVLLNKNNTVYAYADIPTINTVIRNLVSNAIKFTKAGGTVTLQAELVNNNIKVSVTDTGVGINNEKISKLFTLGTNISSPGTMGEKGTGLGLLLCKEFIELNKGKIGVESIPGKGSTFWFTLLAGKEINEENLLSLIKEKQLESLIIEDNFLNLQNTIIELQHAGISYEFASDGNEGIDKALKKDYDFILLDIDLPGKNGIEVNKEIRSKYPAALIIALSSYDRLEIQEMDNSVFFNDYLKKPMKIDDLLYCLKRLKYM